MGRVGGTIQLKVDGEILRCKGQFSYFLGTPKNTAVVGHDTVHGHKTMPMPAYIEGEITDDPTLDVDALARQQNVTVVLSLANGKTVGLHNAFFAGDPVVQTEEGNIAVRWESGRATETTV